MLQVADVVLYEFVVDDVFHVEFEGPGGGDVGRLAGF